jgi:predicted nucleotidyltransferase
MMNGITIDKSALAEFCRQNHICRLSLFGSILRDDFGPDSDVDMLVEFDPAAAVGLIKLAGLELTLTELVGRKVDLRTPQELSPLFRERAEAKADVQFSA